MEERPMPHRSTLVITSFSALALVVLVIWAKERAPSGAFAQPQKNPPVISPYPPPTPAASPAPTEEKKAADPIPTSPPPLLLKDDKREPEVSPMREPSAPAASLIPLIGG